MLTGNGVTGISPSYRDVLFGNTSLSHFGIGVSTQGKSLDIPFDPYEDPGSESDNVFVVIHLADVAIDCDGPCPMEDHGRFSHHNGGGNEEEEWYEGYD